MADSGHASLPPYAFGYDEHSLPSRDALPMAAKLALLDIQVLLTRHPGAAPGNTRSITDDGKVRIYCHPSPPLQVIFEVDEARRVLTFKHFVVQDAEPTKQVFISYSHKDTSWLERLKPLLQPLEDQQLVRLWDDQAIVTGTDWEADIRRHLAAARVAVFLVTPNFLASDFIRSKELPALLKAADERGCVIFWVEISSTPLEGTPLARFQGANPRALDLLSEPEQNELLKGVVTKLRKAVETE